MLRTIVHAILLLSASVASHPCTCISLLCLSIARTSRNTSRYLSRFFSGRVGVFRAGYATPPSPCATAIAKAARGRRGPGRDFSRRSLFHHLHSSPGSSHPIYHLHHINPRSQRPHIFHLFIIHKRPVHARKPCPTGHVKHIAHTQKLLGPLLA